ncbi:hypothetical protein [Streptomyces sp. 8N706]|uniref:hypothetical protein n=1 Tax=Streptomyces sp. 8N706 TaxID=3457416 RepID=UPI003FD2906B
MVVLAVVSAVGLVADERMLVGAPIWFKPLKFSVSFAAYGLTLAWMLSLTTRSRRTGWWAGTSVVTAGTVEMAIITVQVIRGRRSHFNVETPFDQTLFVVMGLTIVALWTADLVIALLLLRQQLPDRATAWAVRLGSLIALAGLALGGLMVRPTAEQQAADGRGVSTVIGAHSVGVPDGGPAMPVTGWSTTGGDLRIPHFVGMHALQALPLFLLVLTLAAARFPRLREEPVRLRLVLVASGVYTAVVALVTWQALRGQPLTHPDGTTLAAAALVLGGGAAAAGAAFRKPPTPASHPEHSAVKEPVA